MNNNRTGNIDASLHQPRILCLHGGGSNAEVFYRQTRNLRNKLEPYFRLVFADGPFLCAPGPGVGAVYEGLAPFRRWVRWLPEHPPVDDETAIEEIDDTISLAMQEDDAKGATGDWVGLFGFSQGAMIGASILLRQQKGYQDTPLSKYNFRFAVVCAGRAPLIQLDHPYNPATRLGNPSGRTMPFLNWPTPDDPPELKDKYLLRLPTVHVHGIKDEGLPLHRKLRDLYCAPHMTRLVQWDGDHRLPLRNDDVDAVVEQILGVARETKVLWDVQSANPDDSS